MVAVGVTVVLLLGLVIGVVGPLLGDGEDPQSDPTPVQTVSPTPPVVEPPKPSPSQPVPPPPRTVPPEPVAYQLPPMEWEPLPTPNFSDDTWTQLQGTILFAEPIVAPTGCPAPGTISEQTVYEAAVREQWACLHDAWAGRFRALGLPDLEPPIIFYEGTGAPSECGYFEGPAFYCSANGGTVHFGSGHLEMTATWDLSINEMVNHEYGHHLQNLAGITDAKLLLEYSDELERRSELQATCWSAAMTFNNVDVDFDEGDWASWQERMETMLIDGIHGSRESLRAWGTRGLYAATLGECNTWAVGGERVT